MSDPSDVLAAFTQPILIVLLALPMRPPLPYMLPFYLMLDQQGTHMQNTV